MTNGEVLGKKLYELRKKNGLSQEELAARLGVSRQAVSKWECGESLPDTDNLITISRMYGVSLDELVGNDSVPKCDIGYDYYDDGDDGETIDSDEEPVDEKRKLLRILYALPYPILVTVMFFIWGFVWDGFYISWTLWFTIPVYYSVIDCIKTKKLDEFAYPVFVTFIYLIIGMEWGLWHPYWIIFITIPIYDAIAEAIDKRTEKKKKAKDGESAL